MRPFPICPPICSHIPFSGRFVHFGTICLLVWIPRLSRGHPGSFTSEIELMHAYTDGTPSLTSLAEDGEMGVKYLSQGYAKLRSG